MKIEQASNPSKQDIEYLTKMINLETLGFGEASPFAFFIKDQNNQIIAGCNGYTIFGAIYTDQLWVHPNYRKKNLGKELMQEVESYAQSVNCTMATICTMSFQNALEFYKKLGYKVDFERPGHTHSASQLFLRKDL
jgi:GNAT superfamily N-acetyltransferase